LLIVKKKPKKAILAHLFSKKLFGVCLNTLAIMPMQDNLQDGFILIFYKMNSLLLKVL
jgi:hypothetical protein